jgi:DNA topoisomerase-1
LTEAHQTLPKPEPVRRASASRPKKKSAERPVQPSQRRQGKLVVVESPAKARTIGRYLGRGYVVKPSVGHVRDLLKSRLSVDIENGFSPEYRVPNDKRKTVKELTEAASRAKEIYLATDPDREGEAIAWHVMEAAGMDADRTKRVVFHEITKGAIEGAFAHPRAIDMNRVDAQQARRILDRLVGYKLSPLLWRKIRGRLSAGRVQSVAVRLVVEREREIDGFVPEEYWTLSAELSRQQYASLAKRPFFAAKLQRLNGKEPILNQEADVLPHLAVLEKATWTVGKLKIGVRKRRPAPPFTTSTLQQEASRRLNFDTSKTMRTAQHLYEGVNLGDGEAAGLITYMRTDSVAVSAEAQAEARAYVDQRFGPSFVPAKPPVYKTTSKAAQEAHEAVRPTSVMRTPQAVRQFLKRDQHRLYQLIWDRFVASQMAPALYDTVSANIWAGDKQIAPNKRPYLFRANGSVLRFAGFLELYEETRPQDRPMDSENPVPSDLAHGEQLDLMKLLPEQHFTQPPPRFSEATLVKALEEHGIGRPSTYASIISTIQQRGYVERENRRLVPTETGQIVNDLLVQYFPNVLSVDFTARLEDELDKIAEGEPWVPVIDGFYSRFSERLAAANKAIPKIELKQEPEPVGRDCPLCGQPLVYREGRYGRFIGCSNFPTCRHTEQILQKVGVPCPKDGGDLVEKRTRKGRVFYGCANYPECDWTSWKRPLPQPCPVCGNLVIQLNGSEGECSHCGRRQPIAAALNEMAGSQ